MLNFFRIYKLIDEEIYSFSKFQVGKILKKSSSVQHKRKTIIFKSRFATVIAHLSRPVYLSESSKKIAKWST